MIFHSIRWRLQLWHGLILLAVLGGFGFTAHRLQRSNELRRVDQELQQRLGPLIEALRRSPPGLRGPPGHPPPGAEPDGGGRFGPPPHDGPGESRPAPREFRLGPGRAALFESGTNPFHYVVWTRDRHELGRSATATGDVPPPTRPDSATMVPTTRARGLIRELYEFTPPGECLLVGRSIAPELANLDQLALWLAGLGGAVLVLGLAGGWWLAARAIRPINDISAAAARIAGGDLSHRINAADTDSELGRLALVLNSTFARLDAAFAQQAQFTSDASHELRTPVTVILSQTQLALARERPAAEYRENLEACQRAAQRMRRLIESLLELARLDAGHEPIKRDRFDLVRTARDCIGLIRPLADERRITLDQEFTPTACLGDPERVAQVITNLLTNAILHNAEGGQVRVTASQEGETAVLSVADSGPGISAEDLPRIFERFYRADKSRAGTTGGSGLGLAISKAIIEAHGGTIEVSSAPGRGATFTVRLPCCQK